MKMKRTNQGFSFIEVLVSVVIVSLGLLGVAGTLLTATRSASSSYMRQNAQQYAYDIIDRMRANSTAVTAGGPYTATPPTSQPSTNCTTTTCSNTAMATWDLWEWQSLLKLSLPQGKGSVTVVSGADNTVTITVNVQWNDSAGQTAFNVATASVTPATYTVVTSL
jgi:type IV pilus assembly protein PilV